MSFKRPGRSRPPMESLNGMPCQPALLTSRAMVLDEANRALRLQVTSLDQRRYPLLCSLLDTGLHYASICPEEQRFRFHGAGFLWTRQNAEHLAVCLTDGRPIVGGSANRAQLLWQPDGHEAPAGSLGP